MRFEDFPPDERLLLLYALDNQIQWLVGLLIAPPEPCHWQSAHEEVRRQRSIDLALVRKLRAELAELAKADLNS